jgi:Transposase DDE domain group 1
VRFKNHTYHAPGKGDLKIEFTKQQLSSYSGLELFRRYFQLIGLHFRVRRAFRAHQLSGDYGVLDCILVFFALWLTGGKRLRHVSYISDDPLVKRLCGLSRIPCDRTLSRFLGQFTLEILQILIELNSAIVTDQIRKLGLPRVTLDFDGTVLTTGKKVKWAFRGYNPHKRYAPSYYPLLCHVAQTGHFLTVKNRPGNVHDSKGALAVIRDCIAQIKTIAPGIKIEVRLDAAFFHRQIITWLDRHGIEYAVKVPMWKWIGIKDAINRTNYWHHHSETISSRKISLYLKSWGREVEFTVVRQKISDKTDGKRHTQLDLFTPDDGIYEYSVIQTNKKLRPDHLFEFYNGRSAMEHQIAEIKNEFAFDSIPTKEYQANSAYQQIALMAYNLVRNFQIDTQIAEDRPATQSRTHRFTFESLKTLRFEWIAVAGRVVNASGWKVLKLAQNERRQQCYDQLTRRLDEMAA